MEDQPLYELAVRWQSKLEKKDPNPALGEFLRRHPSRYEAAIRSGKPEVGMRFNEAQLALGYLWEGGAFEGSGGRFEVWITRRGYSEKEYRLHFFNGRLESWIE